MIHHLLGLVNYSNLRSQDRIRTCMMDFKRISLYFLFHLLCIAYTIPPPDYKCGLPSFRRNRPPIVISDCSQDRIRTCMWSVSVRPAFRTIVWMVTTCSLQCVYHFRHLTIKNGVRLSAFVLTFVHIVMFGLLTPIYVG